jgi:asparagine synthase (glutamine-hydrolysing)
MCGIAGVFTPGNASAVDVDLASMQQVMHHRGPDSTGSFVSEDRRFQAAFVRLSIIDLSTGDQPIVEPDAARVLMGNGEIYNYVELREEAPDYPYQTSGDMEVVFPLATRHGDGFVEKLNGMYGLALYERDPHGLLLVRDRLGIKPLYWARLPGGGVVFGSEIKALFASGLIAPEVNETVISSYLTHGYVAAPNTLYKNVNKLPAAHTLRVDAAGEIEVSRYWEPRGDGRREQGSAAEIRERTIELLRDSVRLQLRSDVPVGALLSGGLDSGIIVSLAAQQTRQPLRTYTVSFEGSSVDEAPLARLVAERYETEHTELVVPMQSAPQMLPKLFWHLEEPLHDRGVLPTYMVTQMLGQDLKVALDGTGGDEIFGGYNFYFQEARDKQYLKVPRWLRRGLIEPALDVLSPPRAAKYRRAEKFLTDPGLYFHEARSKRFLPSARRALGNRQPLPEPLQSPFFPEFAEDYQTAALHADIRTHLENDLLLLGDRTSMAASVESRVPLLDHRLVELGLAMPTSIRTPGGRQKGLERDIAKDLLPEPLLTAPKIGFSPPVRSWMKGELGPPTERLLMRPEALERGWWTADGVKRAMADLDQYSEALYILLALELAVRIHVEGAWKQAPAESIADLV